MQKRWLYLARTWSIAAALWACFVAVRLPFRLAAGAIPMDGALLGAARGLLFGLPFVVLAPAFHQLILGVQRLTLSRYRAFGRVILLFLAIAVSEPAARLAFGAPRPGQSFHFFLLFALARIDANMLAFGAALAATSLLTYRIELHHARLRSVRLQMQLVEARLQVLLLQLQPHFLFNALNSVAELVHRDVDRARHVLARLQELVRSTFDRPGTQLVMVAEEMDWLRAYAEIQETRFADTLVIEFNIAPDVYDAVIPRLLMQPLLENAVRHGIGSRGTGGRVLVEARRSGSRLHLRVSDNGSGVPSGGVREGVGLGLSRRRIAHLYGTDAGLTLRSAPGGGATAAVDLPLRYATADARGDSDGPAGSPDAIDAPAPVPRQRPTTLRAIALGIAGAWALIGLADFPSLPGEFGMPLPPGRGIIAAVVARAWEIGPWIAATPLIILWSRWIPGRVHSAASLVLIHLLVGTAAVLGQNQLYRLTGVIDPDGPAAWSADYLVWGATAYVAIVGITHVWVAHRRYSDEMLAGEVLARDVAQAELDAAGWRLQPDFVAGVLGDVGRLAAGDPSRADALTVALGDLMRLMLDGIGTGEPATTLARELALSHSRLALESVRQGSPVSLEVRAEPEALGAQIPARLVQRLIEYAGGATSAQKLLITAEHSGGELSITLGIEPWTDRAFPAAGTSPGQATPLPDQGAEADWTRWQAGTLTYARARLPFRPFAELPAVPAQARSA